MRTIGRLGTVTAALVLTLAFVACGGGDGDASDSTGPTVSTGGTTASTGATSDGGGTTITISGFAFDPSNVEVSGPTTIAVTNEDGATHTFTTDDGSVDEEIGGGQTVEVQVDVTSDTGFHCTIHPTMTGTLTVA